MSRYKFSFTIKMRIFWGRGGRKHQEGHTEIFKSLMVNYAIKIRIIVNRRGSFDVVKVISEVILKDLLSGFQNHPTTVHFSLYCMYCYYFMCYFLFIGVKSMVVIHSTFEFKFLSWLAWLYNLTVSYMAWFCLCLNR